MCIHLNEKVPSVLRRSRHSAFKATVADLEELAGVLAGRYGAAFAGWIATAPVT